jgi:hypothetical protein
MKPPDQNAAPIEATTPDPLMSRPLGLSSDLLVST